ncbi:MAG TPA: DoxX family protein [Gemmatimonadales bacterium]|nr:DoxX family protein [Gemmatimonadales bacterium]
MPLRRSFLIFHLVLGIGLLIGSIETLHHALRHADHVSHVHVAIIAGVEAVGAVLFLIPRTLPAGTVLLLVTIAGAFVLHAIQGEWRWDLAIYAAGVWYVYVHGHGWTPSSRTTY